MKWVPVIVKFSQTYSKKSLAAITFDDDYSMEVIFSAITVVITYTVVGYLDTEYDDYSQLQAVQGLSAVFTVVAKRDKKKSTQLLDGGL